MADGRAKNGGARPGAGRKPKYDEEELRILLDKSWPLSARVKALKACATKAAEGSLPHIEFLSAYSYGKPKERKEHSTGEDGLVIRIEHVHADPHPAPSGAAPGTTEDQA